MSSNRSQHLEDKAHRAPVLSEVLSCPVCLSIFNNPVTLHCQHNFCKSCLDQSWDQAGTQECPVCWRRSCLEPCPNFTLQNIVESYLKEQEPATVSKGMCILHRESLKLFCLDDHEALCVVCQTSRSHLNHRIWPVEELALDYREQLKKVLIPMEKKMSTFIYFKEECVKSCGYIKTQTQQTETEIKQEFQKLHKFLQDEEAARIAALREEEEQKSEIMKDNIENITREILSLSDTMKSIKLEIGVEDLSFLANIKDTVKRTQCQMQDPEGVSGALIDVAKHLGSLKYRVWEKMLGIVQYTPVTLDPNTVHPHLSLSKDLTSVTCSQKQEFPENPERFKNCVSVLGSEGFTSGRHCWEVEFYI
ncbi:E3 ubiquitin-protein ligase TRIM35 isoform X2 [Amia ocellicauda]|uniref:E3 ubiquitin-protein ligase TRIM35 isoform X2 n=1 Tax=Amia ocellicauda TaxID=2972642 RepID=UPI003463B02A